MEPSGSRETNCVFCKIHIDLERELDDSSAERTKSSRCLYMDDRVFAIPDINPQADHHYLIIPREHIVSAKWLTRKHIPLIDYMTDVALKILSQRVEDLHSKDILMGYHYPPFIRVSHLHLHVFHPVRSMGFVAKQLVFRPGYFFVKPSDLIKRMEMIPDKD